MNSSDQRLVFLHKDKRFGVPQVSYTTPVKFTYRDTFNNSTSKAQKKNILVLMHVSGQLIPRCISPYITVCSKVRSMHNFPIFRLVLPGYIREPLSSKTGPFQCMCHYQIIQKGGVLLPYLVLLIDYSLLHCIIKSFCK